MRGKDEQQLDVFSYVRPEQRVLQDHPLRSLRVMTDEALRDLQPRFNRLYAKTGRPSIAPEKLLRALLLRALYSVRSERMLMDPKMTPRATSGCTQNSSLSHTIAEPRENLKGTVEVIPILHVIVWKLHHAD
jgi:hypothetical protein